MMIFFRIISLLVFVATLALVHAQDSAQTQTAHHQPQVTSDQTTPEHKSAQQHPPSTQTHQNNPNTQTLTQNEASQPNIVTNEVHPTPSATNDQHVANPSVSGENPHETEHVDSTQHHQGGLLNTNGQVNHEHIQKMLSEMTEQQLKAFEDSLEGEARGYYEQVINQNKNQAQIEQAEYEQEYKQIELELTKSQKEFAKQDEQFNKQRIKFEHEYITYHEYLFELNQGANEDFRFSIPNAQQVIFNGYTYQNNDGTYSVTQDIEEQQPITIVVYENNHRIVYQNAFYFKYYASFMGNQNSSYMIRFINPSTHKLVAMNIGLMFDSHHGADKLTVNDVANHSRRVDIFRQEVSHKYTDVSARSVMENENREALNKKLDSYYVYSIVQILLVVVLCVLQVEFVKKLLSTNNIV